MGLLDYVGYAAALFTTGAYVPQVLRVWRTQSTDDISLKGLIGLATGLALWLLHGLLQGDFALAVANAITLALATLILGFKLKNWRQPRT